MLSSIKMIIKKVDEEIPLVIIKAFEIQSCVHGLVNKNRKYPWWKDTLLLNSSRLS